MLKLKTDLHVHTKEDREDFVGHSARQLIKRAAQKALKVLSITNHNTITFNRELERYAGDFGILLIPGVEKTIEGKHVLILNANSHVNKIRTFYDLDRAKKDGVFVIAPHPFFKFKICLEEKLLEHLQLFDAVEFSFCYSRWLNCNRKAMRLASQKRLPMVGNSDCHLLKYLGNCHSVIQAERQTIESVLSGIRNHRVDVVSQPIFLPKLAFMYLEIQAQMFKNGLERNKNVSRFLKESTGGYAFTR